MFYHIYLYDKNFYLPFMLKKTKKSSGCLGSMLIEVGLTVGVAEGGGGESLMEFIEFQELDVIFIPHAGGDILDGKVG